MKYPPTNCVAVDVDGTLHTNGVLNRFVVAWVEMCRAEGMETVLWSARGRAHAVAVAQRFECAHLFDAIISKPGYILDDQGWNWARYTHVVRRIDRAPNTQS